VHHQEHEDKVLMTPHHSCGAEWRYLLHDALSGGVQSTHVSKCLFPTDQKKALLHEEEGALWQKQHLHHGHATSAHVLEMLCRLLLPPTLHLLLLLSQSAVGRQSKT
jgi:hypothetical protein